MEQSDNIGELTAALIKAAAKFKPLKPDKVNPHFKSKFASLQQCIEVTRPALLEAGVFVGQFMEPAPDGFLGVTTQIQCGDQWQRSVLFMPITQATPQAAGSAITYARRYAYCAALGLAPDEDDDGNASENAPEAPQARPNAGRVSGQDGWRRAAEAGMPAAGYRREDPWVFGPNAKYPGLTLQAAIDAEDWSYIHACAEGAKSPDKLRAEAQAALAARNDPDDKIPF